MQVAHAGMAAGKAKISLSKNETSTFYRPLLAKQVRASTPFKNIDPLYRSRM